MHSWGGVCVGVCVCMKECGKSESLFFFSFLLFFVIKNKSSLLLVKIFWKKKVNNVTKEWCTENVELLQRYKSGGSSTAVETEKKQNKTKQNKTKKRGVASEKMS